MAHPHRGCCVRSARVPWRDPGCGRGGRGGPTLFQATVQAVLARIAEDESRHAALAWRTVRWILETHPDLRSELDGLERPHVGQDDGVAPSVAVRNAYGVLSADQRQEVLEDTLTHGDTALQALGTRCPVPESA